jgi:hypothetical protein
MNSQLLHDLRNKLLQERFSPLRRRNDVLQQNRGKARKSR